MQLFDWNSQYEVFVPEIDAEHQAIFRIGAELQQAMVAEAPTERMSEIVRGVMAAVEDHFRHEERLMRKARYLGRDWHKKQHDGVRRNLKEYAKRVAEDDRQASKEMLEYLSHWLHDHTAVTDRMMTACLRNFERRQNSPS
jgi:hemerythrin-like metal-binding protein